MQFVRLILLTIVTFAVIQDSIACSGYKITKGNSTFFGSNHDAWFTTPHIWFETANLNQYGAAFTGARFDGENGYAPQSGMNEMGLAFERLSSYHPKQESFANRKTISNPTKYLKDILHACKTVEEVREYIGKYDHSYFIEDVFIYVDKSGKYLIVEPYKLTIGKEPTYVISNFCPSITPEKNANKLDRYRNGVAFLKNGIDTTLAFCTALSDVMHVCRKKIGDGTLLSSIWDLNNGTVNLYFYHDFKRTVQFNLSEELKKGDHIIAVATLFPKNPEFEKLRNYKTPKDSILIGVFMVASAGFFLLTSIFFLIQYLKRRARKYSHVQLLLFPMGLIMFYYMYVLSGPANVFYFPAPYKDPTNVFISLTSYIPFLLLLLILPFCMVNYRLIKEKSWSLPAKWLFTFNNLIYMILIGLFLYWRFYDVFN
ncbi:hypothetical protein SAMN04487935_2192 [Flavobacterium noncentrifugens]|uniref:Linear amide C-N hydrolases, choloylglycine hydrolase family n=2 Tax=Flavobacterium noncentrifugens TaxID=1128970 RepID=A0A1G8Y5F3_9FLAO|nr:hypothetical protein SAMN04487935_2192 [Flavobacterium noncentrifugens]